MDIRKESVSRAHGQMFLTNVFHIAKVNLNYIRKENSNNGPDNQRNEQEAVFSSMVEGVFAVDSSEKIIRINQAAYNILKITEKNIEGVELKNVIDNIELHKLILFALQQNTPIGQEIIIHNDDEQEQILLAQSAPLLDIHKNKCGTLVVFNVITN